MYVCMYVPTWLVLEISSNAKPLTRLKEHMESRTISIAKIVNLYPLLEVNANLMLALTPSRRYLVVHPGQLVRELGQCVR